eukprot:704327-Amorphochlora_amoeboformis.AAC.2
MTQKSDGASSFWPQDMLSIQGGLLFAVNSRRAVPWGSRLHKDIIADDSGQFIHLLGQPKGDFLLVFAFDDA